MTDGGDLAFATAEADIISLLAWAESHFGDVARLRYQALLATALRDIGVGRVPHDALGIGRNLPPDYGDE